MKHTIYIATLIGLGIIGCKETPTAQEIVDLAIKNSGGEVIDKATVEFDFRDRHYKSIRDGGNYQYERIFKDSLDEVRDVLTNDGFTRYRNGEVEAVADTMATKYTASVNSVLYFALLPYGLNDAAVNKELIGEVTIKDREYYKIKVTFQQDGGGEDFQDVFIYWIGKNDYLIDYLAYSYETDGGGSRFREAYNERIVEMVRMVDYNNYKPTSDQYKLEDYDQAFVDGDLKKLSVIELENVKVSD